ncbi:XRE family transcriptional regulator [Caulobacter sp. BK020]|uniref:XRE family transcriptional regulator n=1 Tax=Caulobacter sp. BK020 TaxID=2512117 RepID=UPI001051BF28|nr:XRE family transcriptional regulator [Caulobacter sp. BK020]TCS18292.1 HTH-type transcriptional regulator/antitoxin HigA [Caulobacter sp. BK020]
MITNERQYRITRAQAEKFQVALGENNELELIRSGVDPIIAAAHKRGLQEQLRELERQLSDYDSLRSGHQSELVADHLWQIGERLIQARVACGLTQRELADRLGVKEQQIQRYEQERYLTANLERLSAMAEALSLSIHVRLQVSVQSTGSPLPDNHRVDASRLPVREMKKRGWLNEFSDEEGDARRSDSDLAALFISRHHGLRGPAALHRMNVRTGSTLDNHAMVAWKARILQKARQFLQGAPTTFEPLDASFVRELVGLSRSYDGPVRAVHALRERGVVTVFEPHLKGTHLDGAALLLDTATPVIGLTLRFDRLDNFWFTLLHELGHVVLHRDSGLKDGFFDDNTVTSESVAEGEADHFAENALIPDEAWRTSFVKFTKSSSEVQQFAKRYNVGDCVVAGRIRRERGYHLFKDLIGSGCVRELISDAGLME